MTADTKSKHFPANPEKFEFDAEVTALFDSMALRSIPGYAEAHEWIRNVLSACKYSAFSQVWDFGTSTGSALKAALTGLNDPQLEYLGCDISQSMLDSASQRNPYATFVNWDLSAGLPNQIRSGKVAVAIYGWTLQFLFDTTLRSELLRDTYDELCEDGKLFVFEKFNLIDSELQAAADKGYYWWRRKQGYAFDEIYAKSLALQKSMFPWEPEALENVLYNLPNARVDWLYRHYQFGGVLVTKR